jgi:NAD(P)-dependent dehydrogenase (short-subunit alcohol dehydrogenase family)
VAPALRLRCNTSPRSIVRRPVGSRHLVFRDGQYSESLDHELRTRGIRVSVVEPAYTKTQFDANFLEPDSKLDEYREVRAALGKTMKEVLARADEPRVVADVVLEAANAARPKLRYTAGGLARRLRFLRNRPALDV